MDKEHKDYLSLKMEEMMTYIAKEYVKDWLLDDGFRIVPPISEELQSMYDKGWKACEEMWSKENIENNIVEVKLFYDPEFNTEQRYRTMFKLLAESLKKQQQDYVEWGGFLRCNTSDGRNVNVAEELNRLEYEKGRE